MKDLNHKIEQSNYELNKGGVIPDDQISEIEYMIQYREKELNSQKITLNMYLQYYDSYCNKARDKETHEKYGIFKRRIGDLESKISMLKSENEEYTRKIKALKNVQLAQSRELEVYNRDKIYPKNVKTRLNRSPS